MEPLYKIKLPINQNYKELVEHIIIILITMSTYFGLSYSLFKKINNFALLNILIISAMIYHLIFKALFKLELVEKMNVKNGRQRIRR